MLKLSNNYQLLTTKSTCLKITSTSFAFISKYLSKIFTNKFSKNFKFLVQNPNKHVIMTCLSTYLLSLINKFSTNFRSKKLMTYMFNIWKASLSFCQNYGAAESVNLKSSFLSSSYFLKSIQIRKICFKNVLNTHQKFRKRILL